MPSASEVHRLQAGLERTIKALRATGRLEPCDALVLALARTAAQRAESPDLSPREQRQWARLLTQLEWRLRSLGAPVDDTFAALLQAASGPDGR
jgi:membrane glycosyltransferase